MFARLHRFSPFLLAVAVVAAGAATLVDVLRPVRADVSELALDVVTFLAIALTGLTAWRSSVDARRTRSELRRSEARQRSVVDDAGEAVIVIDDQARIVTFNAAAERMFGYEAAEIVGDSLERLMTDGMRKAHAAYLAHTGVTAMVKALELRTVNKGVRKRGDVFPFELTMTEWRDGERRMFTGVMRDVTERERGAAALREAQARYDRLYENSPELLFTYAVAGDGEFVLESMNRAAEARSGCARTELIGLTLDQLAELEESRGLKRALLHCVQSGAPVTQTLRIAWRGEMLDLPVALSPMRDGSGEISRILASIRDGVVPEPEVAANRAA